MQGRFQRALGLGAILAVVSACGLQALGDERGLTVVGGGSNTAQGGTNGVPGIAGGTGTGATPTPGLGGVPGALIGPGGLAGGSGGASAGGGSGSNGTTGRTGTGAGPGPAATGLHGQVTIGFIQVTGFSDLGKAVGSHIADMGDAQTQANIMGNYVNAHGGVAGKQMVPLVQSFNAQNASSTTENGLCQNFIQANAFAVVLAGQIHYTTRDCYHNAGIIALEGSNYGFNKDFYGPLAPSEWSPIFPDYDQTERSLVAALRSQNWFAGVSQVGVAYWSDKPYKDVLDKTLTPALAAAGVSVVPYGIDNSGVGPIEQGLNGAIQKFETSGVSHVMFIGSDPLAPFFVLDAEGQHATFVYGLTSWDSPSYEMNNNAAQMAGAAGIGFYPEEDVNDSQYAWPAPGMETLCLQIYKAAALPDYANWHDRQDGSYSTKQAISICENALLVQHVANAESGGLTVANWSAAASRVGTSFQMASPLQVNLGPGRSTGGAAYRVISWGASCSCFRYVSGNLGFG